jgi:hypothetical protein
MGKTVEEQGIKGGWLARAGPGVLRIRVERVEIEGRRVVQSVTLGTPNASAPARTHWILKLTPGAARWIAKLSADQLASL